MYNDHSYIKLSLFPFAIIVGCPGVSKTKSRTCDYRKWKSVWSAQDSSHFPSAINRRAKQAWGNKWHANCKHLRTLPKGQKVNSAPTKFRSFPLALQHEVTRSLCCYTPRWDTNPPLHLVRFPDSSPVWVKGGIVSEECLALVSNAKNDFYKFFQKALSCKPD